MNTMPYKGNAQSRDPKRAAFRDTKIVLGRWVMPIFFPGFWPVESGQVSKKSSVTYVDLPFLNNRLWRFSTAHLQRLSLRTWSTDTLSEFSSSLTLCWRQSELSFSPISGCFSGLLFMCVCWAASSIHTRQKKNPCPRRDLERGRARKWQHYKQQNNWIFRGFSCLDEDYIFPHFCILGTQDFF